jgi:hypothetical protein
VVAGLPHGRGPLGFVGHGTSSGLFPLVRRAV